MNSKQNTFKEKQIETHYSQVETQREAWKQQERNN